MPRKNKEEYNEYMRNYSKRRALEKKGRSPIQDDFNGTEGTANIGAIGDIIKETKELFQDKNKKDTSEPDPVLNAIEKYGKYIPLVIKFFQGFNDAAKAKEQEQQSNNQPKIMCPEGWLSLSPIQKINYKYSRPEWYNAGLAYDNYMANGVNPQVNISYVDRTYNDNTARQESLQSLQRKYPEPPLVKDRKEEIIESKPEEKINETEIINELQKDNLRYIEMFIDYINSMSEKDFIEKLANLDSLITQIEPFISLIPVHLKGTILATPKEDLQKLLQAKCKEKYDLAITLGKLTDFLNIFEKIKDKLT